MMSDCRRQTRFARACARFLIVASTAFTLSAMSGRVEGAGRDWGQHPAIVVIETAGDVYALGDVHGDSERLIRVLVAARIIEAAPSSSKRVRWSAGKAVLVCTGDLIDKGDHSLAVIDVFRALQEDAARVGGRVIVTLGNHEAEFLADPQNGKDANFLGELQAESLDPRSVADGSDARGIGVFLRSLPFAARVNDWFYAHAGNTKGMSIEGLSTAIRKGVDRDGYGSAILKADDSLLEARLKAHPWWEHPDDARGAGEARLRRYLKALGAAHLVIGHQPEGVRFADGAERKKGQMVQHFNGLVFLIDVGMSAAINDSNGSILRIHGRQPRRASVIDHQGISSPLWSESTPVGPE